MKRRVKAVLPSAMPDDDTTTFWVFFEDGSDRKISVHEDVYYEHELKITMELFEKGLLWTIAGAKISEERLRKLLKERGKWHD